MRATSRAPSSGSLVRTAGLLLLAAGALATILVANADARTYVRIYSPTALILFTLLGLAIVLAVRVTPEARSQPFSAFSMACLLWFVGFSYRGIQLSITGAVNPRLWGDPASQLPLAGLLSIAGFLAFWLGYWSNLGKRLCRALPFVVFPRVSAISARRLETRLYLLYGAGWLGRVVLFGLGMYHGQSGASDAAVVYLSWIKMVANFAHLSLWGVLALKNSRQDPLVTFLPWFAIEILYGMIYGGRSALGMGFFVFFATRSLYAIRPVRWHVLLGIIVVSMLFVVPFLTIVRYSYYQATAESGTAGLATAIDATDYWEEAYESTSLENLRDGAEARFGYLDPLLTVLDRVPDDYPFQRGETFIPYTLTALIPRVLWRDKPLFNMGQETTRLFFDHESGDTSTSLGTLGDSYYNFGLFGLVLMVPVGTWLRFHWERYCVYRTLEPISATRIPFLYHIASPMLPLVSITAGFPRAFIDLYVYFFLVLGIPKLVRWRRLDQPRV